MSRTIPSSRNHQRGAVLFVALVFLILITLLALTATGTSILQEKMTGGMRNGQLAMMGSESGLRGEEARLWNLSFKADTGQPLPPCLSDSVDSCMHRADRSTGLLKSAVQQFRTAKAWVDPLPGQVEYKYTTELTDPSDAAETAALAAAPVTLVEDMGADVPPGAGRQSGAIDPEGQRAYRFYRITSRSQGGNAAALRVTESVFSSANLTDTGTEP